MVSMNFVFFFVLFVLAVAENECPGGWRFNVVTTFCYRISSEFQTFDQAIGYCQSLGGEMASISSYTERAALVGETGKLWAQPWLGTRKNLTTGKFYNINNKFFFSDEWSVGQPSAGDCVTFKGTDNIGMQTTGCDQMQPVVCKIVPNLCNSAVYRGTSGTVQSPGYPIQYYNMLQCTSLLIAPDNYYISIYFPHTQTERIYDTIELFEGNSTVRGNMITAFSGNSTQLQFSSKSNMLTVYFFANLVNTDVGFQAYWNAYRFRAPILSNTTESGELSSVNYPHLYENSDDQIYYIAVGEGKKINITVDDFETEAIYDILEIYDGWNMTQNNLVASLSGDNIAPWTFLSTTNQTSLKFRTDSINQLKGWHLNWKST